MEVLKPDGQWGARPVTGRVGVPGEGEVVLAVHACATATDGELRLPVRPVKALGTRGAGSEF